MSHLAVENLKHAFGFSSVLVAAQPIVIKWDFGRSMRGRAVGLDRLDIQDEAEPS
jgi:hypothetical protein